MPEAEHVAPARYVLTVLHRKDPASGPCQDGEGDPGTGRTLCGLLMGESELWRPEKARPEIPSALGARTPERRPPTSYRRPCCESPA